MKNVRPKKTVLIGRREFVNFPALGITQIEAKIDTGAYTSAIHCHSVYERIHDKKNTLCFKVLDPSHPEYEDREYCFDKYEKKAIKNSFGDAEERYVIKTFIKLGGRKINTTLSLTDRGNMRYPVLIGRRFLKNKFVVDVAGLHLQGGIIDQNKH